MRLIRSRLRFALAGLWLLAACGGDGPTDVDDNDDGDGGTGTRMTATIDGQAWSAGTTPGLVGAVQISRVSGGYLLNGIEITALGAPATSMVFSINNIAAPGTFPLGVDGVSVYGGFAGITAGTGGNWTTPISGAAGTITITTLTTTRIAGTFNFTANASGGGATGTRVVTNGVFDAPIQPAAVIQALPDSVGGKMSATLGGVAWNAAIVSGQTALGYLSLSGINNLQTLLFTIPKPATTGTYTLSNASGNILQAWDPNAVRPAGARCCYGIAGDVGTLTITSLTTTRAKGTFSATLRAQPGTAATGQLVIANGTFDMGLFHTP